MFKICYMLYMGLLKAVYFMVPRCIYDDLQNPHDSYANVCLKFEFGQYNLC